MRGVAGDRGVYQPAGPGVVDGLQFNDSRGQNVGHCGLVGGSLLEPGGNRLVGLGLGSRGGEDGVPATASAASDVAVSDSPT